MLPSFVAMLARTSAGLVGTLPFRGAGGLAGRFSGGRILAVGPQVAGGLNGGSVLSTGGAASR